MKLTHLQQLHFEMKKINIIVDTFDYTYNEQICSVIFLADYENGFTLTFFKKDTAEKLKLPVKPGYNLQIQGETFKEFWHFFKLGNRKGKYSIKDFFDHLDNHIPCIPSTPPATQRELIKKVVIIDDPDNLHFKNLINWEKARAKNPNLNKGRDPKNLEKTRLLYPDLYDEIKDLDISVAYTYIPDDNEKQIILTELIQAKN